MDQIDLNTLRSVEELASYRKEAASHLAELNGQYEGVRFTEEAQSDFARTTETIKEIDSRVIEFEGRKRAIEQFATKKDATESEARSIIESGRPSNKERDIYDLSTIRASFGDTEAAASQLHERAMRAVELTRFPLAQDRRDVRAYGVDNEAAQEHVTNLLYRDREDGWLSRWCLVTGNPTYVRAWAKRMSGMDATGLSREEQMAVSQAQLLQRQIELTTTGLPVPFQLDPTVLPTSSGAVNPWRQIASVSQVTVNQWKGATSGAVVASYAAESDEATDNKPTMTQPSIDAARAQAFIPFSIEAGQDWGGLQTEMARLIADGKDVLEAAKFLTGGGTDEPLGLNSMSGAVDVSTTTGGAFVVADLYKLEDALGARFRSKASIVARRATYSKTRQFDTAGGASLWLRLGEGLPNTVTGQLGTALLGYPTFEGSEVAALAGGARIVWMGDFSYYKIIDRIGMSIELIPHLFGTARNYPTGQRGLFAFWRNGGAPLAEAAFKALKA